MTSDRHVLVVLSSLVAEGTPVMALQLAHEWRARGLHAHVATIRPEPTDLLPEFEARGIPVHEMRISQRGLKRYPDLARETHRLVRETGASAVLSMPFGWHAFVAFGARLAGARTVVAHVGNFPPATNDLAFRKFQALVQIGRPWTTRLACCSTYVRDGVVRRFRVTSRETRVVYNGCDVEEVRSRAAAARAQAGVRNGPFRIAMVARLELHKDQPTLLRAMALLRDIDAELWLIGDGSRRAELECEARSLGLAARVKFLGTRRDIPEILGQVDAFAFAAKPDEGFGIALVEAMAAEVPIIATSVGACIETLNGGECGVLVAPQNPTAFAEALRRLAREGPNPGFVRAASFRAEAHYSSHAMASGYAALADGRVARSDGTETITF